MKNVLMLLLLIPITLLGQNSTPENIDNRVNQLLDSIKNSIVSFSERGSKHEYYDTIIQSDKTIIISYGFPIHGYMYDYTDTSKYDKITAIEEIQNNNKVGRRIQFFNYPKDTASVENFQNDTLFGPFFYNHPNGKIWMKGIYKNKGRDKNVEFWTNSGTKIIDYDIFYNPQNKLYYLDKKLCDGKLSFISHTTSDLYLDLFFTNGHLDSAWTHVWTFKKLKDSQKIFNYIDSTYKYIRFWDNGNPQSVNTCKMIINPGNQIQKGDNLFTSYGLENTKLISSVYYAFYEDGKTIHFKGFFKNGEMSGEWKEFDKQGNLINSKMH